MIHTSLNPNEAIELTEFDDTLNEFTFGISENMALAGDGFIDYTVTVTGMTSVSEETVSFNLRIKNPCIDPENAEFNESPLSSKVYTLGDFAPGGLVWEHDVFFEYPSICGSITYNVSFIGLSLN